MSYFINPVEEDRCVFLSYEGTMPAEELSTARNAADGMLNERHWRRMVVDVTQMQSVPPWPELFAWAHGLSKDVAQPTRVALVIRPEQMRRAKSVEKAARNRRVFLTYFLDPKKATAWVKQTSSLRRDQTRNKEPITTTE
jgi:hypothetical protein